MPESHDTAGAMTPQICAGASERAIDRYLQEVHAGDDFQAMANALEMLISKAVLAMATDISPACAEKTLERTVKSFSSWSFHRNDAPPIH